MQLSVLENTYAVCRLSANDLIPSWVDKSNFWTITKTQDELSIVCQQSNIPEDVKSERGWKIIKVNGVLDFGLTGILASLATPLALHKISIFALSTFDTDYILVKENKLEAAKLALINAGFKF